MMHFPDCFQLGRKVDGRAMAFPPQRAVRWLTPRSEAPQKSRGSPPASTEQNPKWLIGFVLLGMFCQLALLDDNLSKLRVLFRCAPFLASAALLLLPSSKRRHPAQTAVLIALGSLVLCIANPGAYDAPLAAVAQIGLNVAIMAPLLWVPKFRITSKTITTIVLLFWFFHSLSAFFGVLQTLYPGSYQPALATSLTASGDEYSESLKMTLADGSTIFRPMGLTDTPGGTAALDSVLFSLALVSF